MVFGRLTFLSIRLNGTGDWFRERSAAITSYSIDGLEPILKVSASGCEQFLPAKERSQTVYSTTKLGVK